FDAPRSRTSIQGTISAMLGSVRPKPGRLRLSLVDDGVAVTGTPLESSRKPVYAGATLSLIWKFQRGDALRANPTAEWDQEPPTALGGVSELPFLLIRIGRDLPRTAPLRSRGTTRRRPQ